MTAESRGGVKVRTQVETWRDELLDLTGRNRLLRYRPAKTSTLEVDGPTAQVILDRLVTGRSRRWPFFFPVDTEVDSEGAASQDEETGSAEYTEPLAPTTPSLHTTKRTGKEVRAACAGLSRRATQEFMDKGIWILYLGVGMLSWTDPADQQEKSQDSPLLLVPVQLVSGEAGESWQLEPAENDIVVNPALWLKLDSELDVKLPEIDPDAPIDVASLLASVRAAVTRYATWSVSERVVLSTFSFHKEAMYRDLRDNMERIVEHPLVNGLAWDPADLDRDGTAPVDMDFDPIPESELDRKAPPEESMTILDADASQRQCIAAVLAGHSFVMDGPPGTGKSQTIANMIAELISAGHTVLFVSEKAAALDVVFKRLAAVGLNDYLLELHSHKTTRKAVAAALGNSLVRRPKPAPSLTDVELKQAERKRTSLSSYAGALNEPLDELGGRTIHYLLGLISEVQHLPQAPVAEHPLSDREALASIDQLGARLRSCWKVVEQGDSFIWRGASAQEWNAGIEQRVQAKLEQAAEALSTLQGSAAIAAEDLIRVAPTGPTDAATLATILDHLTVRPEGVDERWLYQMTADELSSASVRMSQRAMQYQASSRRAREALGSDWERLSAEPAEAQRVWDRLTELGISLGDETYADDLERTVTSADTLAADVERLGSEGGKLATSLGLGSADLTLDDTVTMRRIADIASSEDRPDARWLGSESDVEEARKALAMITPLTEASRQARSAASEFEPTALKLDLQGLSERFNTEHRGLKRLSNAYRADRDLLGATAPAIKPKAAIARIDDAIAWQTAESNLDAEARRHADVLGATWIGPGTDLAEFSRRVDLAALAIRLRGSRLVDADRFANAVASNKNPDEWEDVLGRCDSLAADVRSRTPPQLASIVGKPLDAAAAELHEASDLLSRAARIVAAVDAVRGSRSTADHALRAQVDAGEATSVKTEAAADALTQLILGQRWAPITIDPEALSNATKWALTLHELDGQQANEITAQRLVSARVDPAHLHLCLTAWRRALEAVLLEFEPARRNDVASDLEARFDDAMSLVEQLRNTRGDIEIWIEYLTALRVVRDAGLQPAVDYCVDKAVPATQLIDILRRSAMEATADHLLAERADVLGPLRAADRDRLVREFAALDKQLVADGAHRVMSLVNLRRPNVILGTASVIANEASKKKRHMPVAELLKRAGDVAQDIKPCFMMSPLSVSQYLPPDMSFDYVIFDEASQVRPCDAVNALYRGRAMIVAGDEKQLPPSNFFELSVDGGEEWTADSLDQFDSILEQAKRSGVFRALSLRWHYRSHHEDLIAFSNHRFYGGELVTFPSASQTADALGVALFQVAGVYRRGTTSDNPKEAEAVVDRIFWHAERGKRSIGVVAFSEAQASLIEGILRGDPRYTEERFADLFSDDRLEGLFIKNLENVQGDERDVVIFSIGYGPDEHDKLTMNFGPINNEGGWRRLNVAITRARERVEVVNSFRAARLTDGSKNVGVDALRRYLEFAEHGVSTLAVADAQDATGEPESPFEESVLRVLRGWGHDVVAQVGTAGYRIDLAIRDPQNRGHFLLGIECDGAMYHSSRVARDRDRLRQEILVGLGWKLHRIWGPSWYRDRAGAERSLKAAIKSSATQDTTATKSQPADEAAVPIDFEDLDLERPPPWTQPYVPAVLPFGKAREPADPSARIEVRSLALSVVLAESPIVEDLVVKRVVGAWDMSSTERRRTAVRGCLEELVAAGRVVTRGAAFCTPNQPNDVVRVPKDGESLSQRAVQHVPDSELAAAAAMLVEEARVITEEEAAQRVARLFGWRRNGQGIAAALARVIGELVSDGRINRDGAHLRPAARRESEGSQIVD